MLTTRRPSHRSALAALLLTLLACQAPARAQLVVSAPSLIEGPGASSGSFDITLTNSGASTVQITSDAVGVSLQGPGTGVNFTDATFSSPTGLPYLFTPSLDQDNGLTLYSNSLPSQTLTLGDSSSNALGFVDVAPNATLLLGYVSFKIDPGAAAGLYAIHFDPTSTNFADTSRDVLTPTTVDGSITLASVPEPSTLMLSAIAAAALVAWRTTRRRPSLA